MSTEVHVIRPRPFHYSTTLRQKLDQKRLSKPRPHMNHPVRQGHQFSVSPQSIPQQSPQGHIAYIQQDCLHNHTHSMSSPPFSQPCCQRSAWDGSKVKRYGGHAMGERILSHALMSLSVNHPVHTMALYAASSLTFDLLRRPRKHVERGQR